MKSIHINGNMGEGGGAILRVSAGLSCARHVPIIIDNIRTNRKIPGLRQQHLLGILALEELTDGTLSPIDVGTTALEFTPGSKWKSEVDITIPTAGNIGLLCQTLQNALFLAPNKEFKINFYGGGTYGKWAPGPTFLKKVLFSIFKKMGYDLDLEVIQHGFYPKGGSKCQLIIKPNNTYKGIHLLERGELEKISIHILCDNRLKRAQVAERVEQSIRSNINDSLINKCEVKIHNEYVHTLCAGIGVDSWLDFSSDCILGSKTMVGEKKLSSEKLGKFIAHNLNDLWKGRGTVDEHTSDQILPFLAFVDDKSTFCVDQVSSHLKTNIDVIQHFTSREITIKKKNNIYEISILDQ